MLGIALALSPVEAFGREPAKSTPARQNKAQAAVKAKQKKEKDESAPMTAIALAESGGRSGKSSGPGLRAKKKGKKETELSPWTVTHGSNRRGDSKPAKKKLSR